MVRRRRLSEMNAVSLDPTNPMSSSMLKSAKKSKLELAFQWSVVKRALIMALIVGFILVGINHGTCIYSGHFGVKCVWQSMLTVLVPYAVSTVSSVMAMSESDCC